MHTWIHVFASMCTIFRDVDDQEILLAVGDSWIRDVTICHERISGIRSHMVTNQQEIVRNFNETDGNLFSFSIHYLPTSSGSRSDEKYLGSHSQSCFEMSIGREIQHGVFPLRNLEEFLFTKLNQCEVKQIQIEQRF